MSEVIVFYAGKIYWEYKSKSRWHSEGRGAMFDSEIYNGAYVWHRREEETKRYSTGAISAGHWYRMDGTPVLLEDVPKQLRAWVLILS